MPPTPSGSNSLETAIDELIRRLAAACEVPLEKARRSVQRGRVLVPGWQRRRRRDLLVLFLAGFLFCLAVGLMHEVAARM